MSGVITKRRSFTIMTPIPALVPHQLAINLLHDHTEIFNANSSVLGFRRIKAPQSVSASEESGSTWYEIEQRVQPLPGLEKVEPGRATSQGCFYNTPQGLRAHIYGGLSDIELRYSYHIGGNKSGAGLPRPLEPGLGSPGEPPDGLYLRLDVETTADLALCALLKSQLQEEAEKLVARIIETAGNTGADALCAMAQDEQLGLQLQEAGDISGPAPASTPAGEALGHIVAHPGVPVVPRRSLVQRPAPYPQLVESGPQPAKSLRDHGMDQTHEPTLELGKEDLSAADGENNAASYDRSGFKDHSIATSSPAPPTYDGDTAPPGPPPPIGQKQTEDEPGGDAGRLFFLRARAAADILLGLSSEQRPLAGLVVKAAEALREQAVPFDASFTSQIRRSVSVLRAECSSPEQIHVAEFLQVFAPFIAARTEARIKSYLEERRERAARHRDSRRQDAQKVPVVVPDAMVASKCASDDTKSPEDSPPNNKPAPDEILREISETVGIERPQLADVDFSRHWRFLSTSRAFAAFQQSLHELASPDFFSEARRFVGKTILSGTSDEETRAEGRRILEILTEMQMSMVHNPNHPALSFRRGGGKGSSYSDRLKLAVEATTGTEWEWWPLREPDFRKRPAGGVEISWPCLFRSRRSEIIALLFADRLREIAQRFSQPPDAKDISPQDSTDSLSGTSEDGGFTSFPDRESTSEDYYYVGSSDAATAVSTGDEEAAVVSVDGESRTFVSLLVLKTSRYVLSSIDITDMNARDLFQALIATYNEKRGFLRRFLSVYTFSHCDFVKVKRHRPHHFSPIPGFSFPGLEDKEYQEYTYSPQPMLAPPITRNIFHDLFYACYDDTLGHRLHSLLPAACPCDVIRFLPDELLDNMPKRDREVVPGACFRTVENFWGLVAREQRSALRVIVFMLLSLSPTVWFLLAWLFEWGHEYDLQDAMVPVTISMTILTMLWTVVYTPKHAPED